MSGRSAPTTSARSCSDFVLPCGCPFGCPLGCRLWRVAVSGGRAGLAMSSVPYCSRSGVGWHRWACSSPGVGFVDTLSLPTTHTYIGHFAHTSSCAWCKLCPVGGLLPCMAAFDGSLITHSWANARCNGVFKTPIQRGRRQHKSAVDVHILLRLACSTDRRAQSRQNTATTDDYERRGFVMGRFKL